MQNFNIEIFKACGVYSITCRGNRKIYIGSTTMSFQKRFNQHRSSLRKGTHKNAYLQNSWNKYGEDNFLFSAEEITSKDNTLEREQWYMDTFKPEFNINPSASGTPNMVKEVIEKRSKSFKKTIGEAMSWYYKIKSGDAVIDEVPDEYTNIVESRLNLSVWNKGLTSENFDYSFLKVPKTITPALLTAHKNTSRRTREREPKIQVFTKEGEFLGEWNCSKDLEEWSLTEDNNLPIKSRFKDDRMSKPKKYLSSGNIKRAVKQNKPYKNLIFKTVEKVKSLEN